MPDPVTTGTATVRCVSVVPVEELAAARTMAASVRRHHPDWSIELVLIASDAVAVIERRRAAPDVQVFSVEERLELAVEQVYAQWPAADRHAAMTARLLARCCAERDGPVLHLPPAAWAVGSLERLVAAAQEHPVRLVRRVREPLPPDGLDPSSEALDRDGRVIDDLILLDGSPAAWSFVEWWRNRCDRAVGAPTQLLPRRRSLGFSWGRRALELALARPEVELLEDPGVGLSGWNLFQHELDGPADALVVDGEAPLALLHLHGFSPLRPWELGRHASRARFARSSAFGQLVVAYAEELLANGWRPHPTSTATGATLPGGLRFDDALIELHQLALAEGADLGDPFEPEGAARFLDWLREPARRGGRHGVNRYLHYRVVSERPDVVEAFPDLDGPDGPALVRWSHGAGRDELGIPEPLAAGEPPPAPPADALSANPGTTPTADRLAVRVQGYMGHLLGLGAAARGYAAALSAAQVPVSTLSLSIDHLQGPAVVQAGYGRQAFEDLVGDGRHSTELICVNPDELDAFVKTLGSEAFHGRRIGVWGWETDSIPARWAPAFAFVDEIWVYSRFVAENIAAVTDVPVIALPPPVTAPEPPATPDRLGVPEGFLFLFAFDYASTIQRKNPVGLIEAFKRAFAPGAGPQLLIKTLNGPRFALDAAEVAWATEGRPDIHLIDRSLSTTERDGLMRACDCYVSLHRSEGFGLTMAEAMAIGKPVIGTGYSGNTDFMNADNSHLVEHGMTRVGPGVAIYPADGRWAEPDLDHAAELMRQVAGDPASAAALGARAAADIARQLSAETTGAAMRARLEETLSGTSPTRYRRPA